MVASLLRSTLAFTRTALPRSSALSTPHRALATSSPPLSSFSRPSPPLLPPKEQREFEELLRRVNAPASAPTEGFAQPEGEEVQHPDYRARPKAQFEGETNPRTGEVGGPKREPLEHGDWAYGGKVTDF
ncbi:hypothetical protein JCM8547_009087 [Rhodosporidiobolus lusitaniae]